MNQMKDKLMTLTQDNFHKMLLKNEENCNGLELHLRHLWNSNNFKSIFYITGLNFTNMNKLEKLNKITELEKELQKLKIEVEKESNGYSWENCFKREGYYIDQEDSEIVPISFKQTDQNDINTFRTEKEAKSALAMAQLSHIIYVANGCEELDWTDNTSKYTIERLENYINFDKRIDSYQFLAFKSDFIRYQVLEQNEQLIKDYLMNN